MIMNSPETPSEMDTYDCDLIVYTVSRYFTNTLKYRLCTQTYEQTEGAF